MTTGTNTSTDIGSTTQTTLGTITTGVWHGSVIGPTYGGTGVNNGASTFTIGGNFAMSGAYTFVGTLTGNTTVTFPTSGTLITTATANVISVTGTSNQILVSPTTGNTVVSILSNPVLPGTGGVQIPGGTTAQRAGSAGTIRFNSQSSTFESTVDGATWATIETSATGVVSVSGDLSTISVSPTTGACVVSILNTYVGQTSITTLGTIGTGTWAGTSIALAHGGTNANLTASNGGIFYSTASAGAILAGTATQYQMLQSGASGAPAWSTATYPSTTTINQILYSTSNNVIGALANGTTGQVLTATTGSAPSWQASAGAVTSVTGTTNQILVSPTTGACVVSIVSSAVLPGTPSSVNYLTTSTSTVSATSTTTLTVTSTQKQVLTGSQAQIYKLPDATTLTVGWVFEFNNNSSGICSIADNSATVLYYMPAGAYTRLICLSTGSAAGTWDEHSFLPSNCVFGNNGATISGTLLATTSISTPEYFLTGSGSGTISILPQAAAGTYNFNLPITAGTSGYVLTSAGGGSSPMTWTNLGSAAVTSIAGTANQITASASTGAVTLSLPSTLIAPGTFAVGSWTINTATLTSTGAIQLTAVNGIGLDAGTGNITAVLSGSGAGTIGIYNAGNTHYVAIQAPTLSATTTWKWPAADGAANTFMQTDGSGNLTFAAAGGGSNAQIAIHQVAHGLSVGNVVYLNSTTYTKAKADNVATAEGVGVVSVVTDADNFTLVTSGQITTLSGLTAGTVYWLSDATAGLLTGTAPVTVGNVQKPMLVAYSSTTGIIINYRGEVIPTSFSLPVSLANGGTNADLTAVAGALAYSTASAIGFTAAGTSGQIIVSQGTSEPVWTTSTYPTTNAAYTLLYASSANTMAALSNGTTGQVLAATTSAAPSWITGGEFVIATKTVSGSPASITFQSADGFNPATYSYYRIRFTNVVPNTGADQLRILLGTGGTPTYASSAYYEAISCNAGSSALTTGSAAAAYISIVYPSTTVYVDNVTTAAGAFGDVYFYNLDSSSIYAMCRGDAGWYAVTNNNFARSNFTGGWAGTGPITGIKILFATETMASGTFTLYGGN